MNRVNVGQILINVRCWTCSVSSDQVLSSPLSRPQVSECCVESSNVTFNVLVQCCAVAVLVRCLAFEFAGYSEDFPALSEESPGCFVVLLGADEGVKNR